MQNVTVEAWETLTGTMAWTLHRQLFVRWPNFCKEMLISNQSSFRLLTDMEYY